MTKMKKSKLNFTRINKLIKLLAEELDPKVIEALLLDLCTTAELEAIADRLHVVPMIANGEPYRKIHEKTGVSVTTIGRVAKHIQAGNGGYRKILEDK